MDKAQFKKWRGFLLFINDEPLNRDLIMSYFFERFADNPKVFYNFILYIKRNIQVCREKEEKVSLSNRYLSILSPLCERFSFFKEKLLLDDLCFKIIDPEAYSELDRKLAKYKQQSKKVIAKILSSLNELLRHGNYKYELKGRYKNIYSIYKKLQKKPHRNILDLHDIFAFRIILKNNSIDECFEIVNLLHDRFKPIVSFFKDYITIPKINGYQSLHTGLNDLIPNLDLPVEVQIRTQAMNDYADKGLATHWLYAIHKKSALVSEKEQKLLHYISAIGLTRRREKNIYFFSYKGDIFKIGEGATVLDFAYMIHSDIGNKTKAALVNGKKQDPYYRLQDGDRVQIVTSYRKKVKKEWLSHVTTRHAYKQIKEAAAH
jgi:GTP diphosphokinase / guanosine-3',5'-bis(diphosphate) 3'-diphosphatase